MRKRQNRSQVTGSSGIICPRSHHERFNSKTFATGVTQQGNRLEHLKRLHWLPGEVTALSIKTEPTSVVAVLRIVADAVRDNGQCVLPWMQSPPVLASVDA